MGQSAAFSFYPGKNLGACGEGGAVTTNDAAIAKKVALLRDHGQSKKYYHEVEGYNGRLDSLQAGILGVKLRYLAEWNAKRQQAAQRYDELFSSVPGVMTPPRNEFCRSVYHLYAIRVQDRAGLQEHLSAANIGTGIHYPVPLHLQRAYEHLGYRAGDFPIAEAAASEILSLPIYPQLLPEQQARVASNVKAFVSRQHSGSRLAQPVPSPVAIS
jgi:dTDP-4-amino-4,6-dideoxygalactose transaminase